MADRTMRQEKLHRLGDDILKTGCSAYLWYQEKTRPKTYGPHLTFAQYKELRKSPLRKKWDAFYYRHMGWMYRRQDESFAQYFKRGLPALLFLWANPQTHPKKFLAWYIAPLLLWIGYPLFMGSVIPGWEFSPFIFRLIGETAAREIFPFYALSLVISGGVLFGLSLAVVVISAREEIRQGIFWTELVKPVMLPYRYVRRFFVKPVAETLTDEPQDIPAPQPRLAFLKNAYRHRSRHKHT
jgi:hypothetical protein